MLVFNTKEELISYLLEKKLLFNTHDQIIFGFDFEVQDIIKYLTKSEEPSIFKDMLLENMHFKGIASFSSLEIRSMYFRNCIFDQGLNLNTMHIHGELSFIMESSFVLNIRRSIIEKNFITKMTDESVIFDFMIHETKINGSAIIETEATKPEQPSLLMASLSNHQPNPPLLKNSVPKNTTASDNFNRKILADDGAVIIAPFFTSSQVKGDININAKISSEKKSKKPNLHSFEGFTHIASNAVLFELVLKESTVGGSVNFNLDLKGYEKNIDISTLKALSHYQLFSINGSFLSNIIMDSSTIKGLLKTNVNMDSHPDENPYIIHKDKYFAANRAYLFTTNISKSIVKQFLVDFPSEKSPKNTELTFTSKEAFFSYLQKTLLRSQPITIGNKEPNLNLDFDISLDDLGGFLENNLSLSFQSITFINTMFNKKIKLSDRYSILLVFDNCRFSKEATQFLSRVVPQQVDILYYNA